MITFPHFQTIISGITGDPEVQEELTSLLNDEAINSFEGFRREADRIHGSEPFTTQSNNTDCYQPPNGPPDPYLPRETEPTGSRYSEIELQQIRNLWPWTCNLPVNLIQRTSIMDLSSMNKSNQTSTDMSRQGMTNQLQANTRSLALPKHTGSHLDDSLHKICRVRFDRFSRLSVRDLIAEAKKIIPREGHPPSDNYDLEFFGLSHCISARGWIEVHNPASTTMCLKMFSRHNSSSTSSSSQAKFSLIGNGEAIGVGENYKEIASMQELRQSLRAYQMASLMALPWYPAPAALIIFLEHNQFLSGEIHSGNQARVLTDFINTVFLKNAKLWGSSDPPLSVELLRNTWQHFVADNNPSSQPLSLFQESQRPIQVSGKNPGFLGKQRYSNTHQTSQYNTSTNTKYANGRNDICNRYNQGRCPFQKQSSCIMPSRNGTSPKTLRHVCLKCYQPHPLNKHK